MQRDEEEFRAALLRHKEERQEAVLANMGVAAVLGVLAGMAIVLLAEWVVK